MSKVRELFTDESKWTRGVYARNSKGRQVALDSRDACRWCLVGAIIKCHPDNHQSILMRAFDSLGRKPAVYWNDDEETTFPMVKALVEELDI